MKNIIVSTLLLAIWLISCTTNSNKLQIDAQPDDVSKSQETKWDRSFGGADKSYDSDLLQLREKIAPRFQTMEFTDKLTGKTMTYNLFAWLAALIRA